MLVQVTCLLVIVSIYLFIRKKATGPVINVDELKSALIAPFKSNNSKDVTIKEIDVEFLHTYGIRAVSLEELIIKSLNDQGVDTDSISPSLNYVNFIDIARRVNLYDITASINDKIRYYGLSVNGLVDDLNRKYPELVDNLLARLALALKVDVKTLYEHRGVIIVASIVAQFTAHIFDSQNYALEAALVIAVACAFNYDGLTHPLSKAFNNVSKSLTNAVKPSKKYEDEPYISIRAKMFPEVQTLYKQVFDNVNIAINIANLTNSIDPVHLSVAKTAEAAINSKFKRDTTYNIDSISCKLFAIDCYNLATNIEINNFCNKYRNELNELNELNEDCYNEFKNISKRIQNTFNKLDDIDYENITSYYKNQYELYNMIEQECTSKELFISKINEILTRIKIGTTNDQYILISPTSSVDGADGGRRHGGDDYIPVGADGGRRHGGDDYIPVGADGGRRHSGDDIDEEEEE
jgi:hypothetical protein